MLLLSFTGNWYRFSLLENKFFFHRCCSLEQPCIRGVLGRVNLPSFACSCGSMSYGHVPSRRLRVRYISLSGGYINRVNALLLGHISHRLVHSSGREVRCLC